MFRLDRPNSDEMTRAAWRQVVGVAEVVDQQWFGGGQFARGVMCVRVIAAGRHGESRAVVRGGCVCQTCA